MTDTTSPEGDATAAAPNGDSETSATPPTPEGGTTPPESKVPEWAQKRFNELTAQLRANERDAAHWREVAMAKAQQPAPQPEPAQGEPTLEQFEYDQAKYAKALVAYELKRANEQAEKDRAEHAKQEAAAKRFQSFAEREAAFAASNPGYRFASAIGRDQTIRITEPMAEAILEADDGPALLNYLDQHREEAARIAALPNSKAVLALGKLAASLSVPPTPPPEPQITAAPKPVPTVKPSAPTPKGLSDDLPVKEWLKLRNKQTARGG